MSAVSIREISIPLVLAFGIMASIGMSLYTFGQYREATTNDIESLKQTDRATSERLTRIEENLGALVQAVREIASDRGNRGIGSFTRLDCAALMMQLKINNPTLDTPDCFSLPRARRFGFGSDPGTPSVDLPQ